jgi:hypothetical protein
MHCPTAIAPALALRPQIFALADRHAAMVAGVEVTAAGLGGSDRRCGEAEKQKNACNKSHEHFSGEDEEQTS